MSEETLYTNTPDKFKLSLDLNNGTSININYNRKIKETNIEITKNKRTKRTFWKRSKRKRRSGYW